MESLTEICEKYIKWYRKNVKEIIDSVNQNLIQSVLAMIDSLLI